MPDIPNKSTFSQNDLDALFAGGGKDIQPTAAPAAPAATPPPVTAKTAPVPPAPVAPKSAPPAPAAPAIAQPPKPASPAPVLAASPAKPLAAPVSNASTPPVPAPVPASAPPQAAVPTSPRSLERTQWVWAVAGFASGLAIAFGIVLFRPPAGLIVASTPNASAPAPRQEHAQAEPTKTPATSEKREPANPQQQVLVGSPMSVFERFNALEGYGISLLKCTGYTQEGEENVPVITLVAIQQAEPDKLICTTSGAADNEVNSLLTAGYGPKFSLVSLPAFRLDTGKPSREWSMFALQKTTRKGTARMTLFETTPRTAQVFKEMLLQGWRITSIEGRPVEIQTAYSRYPSTLTAVFLEMPW